MNCFAKDFHLPLVIVVDIVVKVVVVVVVVVDDVVVVTVVVGLFVVTAKYKYSHQES